MILKCNFSLLQLHFGGVNITQNTPANPAIATTRALHLANHMTKRNTDNTDNQKN